jgi:cathepsin A (carboxypeptidase C)
MIFKICLFLLLVHPVFGFNQYSGYINVNSENNSSLFYWVVESQNDPKLDPLVLWLNGGPGSSSMVGFFYENGPFYIQEDLTLKENNYSWNKNATMLYIDQPVGTGLSFGPLVSGPEEATSNIITFFNTFFKIYPQYLKLNFYMYGESYAGHYIPLYAVNIKKYLPYVNLIGVGIGNGFVDEYLQDNTLAEYGYQAGVLDKVGYKLVQAETDLCRNLVARGEIELAHLECDYSYDTVQYEGFIVNSTYILNPYDIREKCCYNMTLLTLYLDQPSVRQKIGVPLNAPSFSSSNNKYSYIYRYDMIQSYRFYIEELLSKNITVLSYNGVYDIVCNYLGQEVVYNSLKWLKSNTFRSLSMQDFYIQGQLIGQSKSVDGLTLLNFYNAGHLVPMNQPYNSLLMFNWFCK